MKSFLNKYKSYLICFVAGGTISYFSFNNSIKAKQLHQIETKYEALHVDSLIETGHFREAIEAYESNFREVKDDGYFLEVKKLLARENELQDSVYFLRKELKNQEKKVSKNKPYPVTDKTVSTDKNLATDSIQNTSNLPLIKPDLQVEEQGALDFVNSDGVTVKYLGSIDDKKASGFGFAIFDRKGFYEGNWDNNQRNGQGIYIWQNGDRYEGDYDHDVRVGRGTYFFSSGEIYSGQWVNNVRQGEGKIVNRKGKVIFEGKWYDDEPVSAKKKKKSKD